MRLNKSIIATILFSILLFSNCGKCRKCKKDVESLLLIQGKFNSIDFMMPGKITIIEDPEESSEQVVIMRGPVAQLEAINRTIDETGKWSVIYGLCVSEGCPDVDILIVVKDFSYIKNLTVSDAGKIFIDTSLSVQELTLDMSGEGEINIKKLDILNLISNISGSGKINIGGSALFSTVNVSGSGTFEGFKCETNKSTVVNSGSGISNVKALNELDVTISGSGGVFYLGSPATINSEITGSGTLNDAN